jgi:hypothetical protein
MQIYDASLLQSGESGSPLSMRCLASPSTLIGNVLAFVA